MHVAISAHFWERSTTGSGQYLYRLVEAMRRQEPGLRLTLLADAAAARRAVPSKDVAWEVLRTPFDSWNPNLAKLWFEQVALPRAAATLDADLLHVPYFAPPLRRTLPTIVTVHDLIPMILPAYRGSALVRGYTSLVARAARYSDHILADSDASRRDILRLLAVAPERVTTVYLAADDRFHPQPPDAVAAVQQKFNLPEHFALYLGGFDTRKNVPLLLEALARSQEAWPLVIAGKLPQHHTPFTPDPRRLASELGVERRVHFTGWIEEEEKAPLLAAAALFVFPSRYEGFGLPILEAMACGTATLTTKVSSLPELAGAAAVLVPPDNAQALQEAMDHLMTDEVERATWAARGPTQAAHFSWERCAIETLQIYRSVVEGA
ncbi:MAG: glycosyltransferase family 4 protein [Chloroflexota bacterium]|nr:glycosyltransferase family 4 protein [Chloroflexota bacterium]